jgi:hypothetical protein
MAEVGNMGLPPKLLATGVKDMVRISDARMSGTAYGTVCCTWRRKPLPAVRWASSRMATGSSSTPMPASCSWTSATKKCNAAWPNAPRCWQRAGDGRRLPVLYIDHVLQADEGCDFDFLVGCRGAAVPKHSH